MNHRSPLIILVCLLIITSLSGCLEEDISDPKHSIPSKDKLTLSFKSDPNEPKLLGILNTGYSIAAGTLDVVVYHNGSAIHCGDFSSDNCQIGGGVGQVDKDFTIRDDTPFPSCYNDCHLELKVYYLGDMVAILEAINF